MASAQSSSLRAVPGYSARPSSTSAFPVTMPTLGALPTVPTLDRDAATPGYVGRQLLSQRLGQIGTQQGAAFTGIKAGAKQALAGYGGYVWGTDDPNTAQDESLLLSYDSSKGMGEREKGAYRGSRDQSNAAGMLESSFANQNIASAIQRVSLEAQQIANQYAASINQTATQFANEAASITSDWAGLYGSDSAWLVANPPPAVPDSEALHPGNPAGVAYVDPARPGGPLKKSMTYSDFLRGRKSTGALAREWDATYNYGRRFG